MLSFFCKIVFFELLGYKRKKVNKFKSDRHFKMIKSRVFLIRIEIGLISPYLQPKFEVFTSSCLKFLKLRYKIFPYRLMGNEAR